MDEAYAIAVDATGNVFVTGRSLGSDFYDDFATVAYSGAGVPLWTNRFNGPANGSDQATAIAVDRSGNVFVTGKSSSDGSYRDAFDYLTVKYGAPATPPSLTSATMLNGQFRFQFNAAASRPYVVEFRDELNSGVWATWSAIAAQPAATNLSLTNAVNNRARFFRIRTP